MAESGKMMNKKKQLLGIVLLLVLAAITLFVLYRTTKGMDSREILEFLGSVDLFWVVLAAVSAVGCIAVEAWIYLCLCSKLGYRVSYRNALMWASADYYISGLTPLATGGQPAAAYFMQKDGVPLTKSSLLLVFNTMEYQLSLLVMGAPSLAIALGYGAEIPPLAGGLIAFGFVAMTVVLIVCFLCMVRSGLIRRICSFFIRLLTRLRLMKDREKRLAGLDVSLAEYGAAAELVRKDRGAVLSILGMNILQRTATALPVCLLALGLGFPVSQMPLLFALNVLCVIGAASIPIPGTVGAAELIFILLMEPWFHSMTPSVMLVNRILVFYLCVIIGGVWTWIRMAKPRQRRES